MNTYKSLSKDQIKKRLQEEIEQELLDAQGLAKQSETGLLMLVN